MNRLLKFRVWDKAQNRYLDTRDNVNYQLKPTYEESRDVEMGRGVGFVNLAWAMQRPEQYEVEQFTGLIDAKGREVSEGDIVRWGIERMICRYTVQYGEYLDPEWGRYLGFYLKPIPSGNKQSLLSMSPIEIIGNIHENPELLNPS